MTYNKPSKDTIVFFDTDEFEIMTKNTDIALRIILHTKVGMLLLCQYLNMTIYEQIDREKDD